MKKNILITFIYAAIIALVIGSVMYISGTDGYVDFQSADEVASFDFSKGCGRLNQDEADIYNNQLLTPETIGSAVPDNNGLSFKNYVTYHFTVPVKDGEIYGITYNKSDYATNIYVDGKLVTSTGKVADNKEGFKPTAAGFEAFFTGQGDTAEIVAQQANFNHHKNYGYSIIVGPSEKISEYNRHNLLSNSIIVVILLTSFLINTGMFLCFPKKKELFHFSILCLTAAINSAVPKITAFVLPQMNWYVSHKIEVSSTVLTMLFLLLYTVTIFDSYINQKAKKLALTVSFIVSAVFIFTPPAIYTRLNEVSIILTGISTIPLLASLIINIIKKRKTLTQSNKLASIGIIFVDSIAYVTSFNYGSQRIAQVIGLSTGFALFVFFNSISLAIDFKRRNEALEEAEARERELSQTNELLTRLDTIRKNFLADLSHELKTPLTIIASRAAVASKQVSMGRADANTAERLDTIEREAVRLGEMVERMKNSSIDKYSENLEELNMRKILLQASDFCIPVCARNGNTISVECEDEINVYSSSNTLFHCLYNLISNATKHSRDSLIELICKKTGDGFVTVSVRDYGTGMKAEDMEHAFERGFSGDSSTGIGLSLCKEMVENVGGRIYLENTEGGGLTVSFTVKEAGQNGKNTAD